MKKINSESFKSSLSLFMIIAALFMTIQISAQNAELFGFSGYTFADKFPISGGAGKIYNGHTYGGSLGYNLGGLYLIELSYTRQNTTVSAYSQHLPIDVYEKANVNYIFAGGNRIIPLDEKFSLLTGFKVGAFILGFNNNNFENVTRFAVGVNAGFRYLLTPNLGLRAQGQLYFPITDVGANLWWSSGGGVDVGVSSYTPLLQFGFTGGLFFIIQ